METVTSVIFVIAIGVYLCLISLVTFLWMVFRNERLRFHSNRNYEPKYIEKKIDTFPRPSKKGLKIKPKYQTDEQLFEYENKKN